MKTTTLIAAAAIATAGATTATAGNILDASNDPVIEIIDVAPPGSSAGSMGSLGGGVVVPALIGLLVVGALAAGGGS